MESEGQWWTVEQKELLKELWAAGEGVNRIAVRVAKTTTQVNGMRYKLKLPRRQKYTVSTDPNIQSKKATVKREWIAGTSIKRIASMCDMPEHWVTNTRAALGLQGRRSYSGNKAMVDMHVYLNKAEDNKVGMMATKAGMSKSSYVRKLILRDINQ